MNMNLFNPIDVENEQCSYLPANEGLGDVVQDVGAKILAAFEKFKKLLKSIPLPNIGKKAKKNQRRDDVERSTTNPGMVAQEGLFDMFKKKPSDGTLSNNDIAYMDNYAFKNVNSMPDVIGLALSLLEPIMRGNMCSDTGYTVIRWIGAFNWKPSGDVSCKAAIFSYIEGSGDYMETTTNRTAQFICSAIIAGCCKGYVKGGNVSNGIIDVLVKDRKYNHASFTLNVTPFNNVEESNRWFSDSIGYFLSNGPTVLNEIRANANDEDDGSKKNNTSTESDFKAS